MNRRDFMASAAALPLLSLIPSARLRMLVIGDSVAWGQGLEDAQKIHSLVTASLAANTGISPSILHYAASGATIGFNQGSPTPGARIDSWWPRELPENNPTLYEQCLQVQADHPDEKVDLILLSGGINDVSIATIFNPFTDPLEIERQSRIYCHDAMATLLDHIQKTFLTANPQAKVVVLGYYAVFSAHSKFPDVWKLIEVLIHEAFSPPALYSAQLRPLVDPVRDAERRMIRNGMAFRDAAKQDLLAAVQETNVKGGANSFVFVDPDFTDDDAAFTDAPLLWDLDRDMAPKDPRAADRRKYCAELETGPGLSACDRASLGHPNIQGARKYANKILTTLTARVA